MRDQIIEDIIKEVCGPDPHPAYKDAVTGEEILLERVHGSPKLRYGAGMLYPQATNIVENDEGNTSDEENEEPKDGVSENGKDFQSMGSLSEQSDSDESIGLANEFLPSAMGFTCKLKICKNKITLNVNSAWYQRSEEGVAEKRIVDNSSGYEDKINTTTGEVVIRRNWVRRPISVNPIELDIESIGSKKGKVFEKILNHTPWDPEQKWLTLQIYNRSRKENLDKGECIITVTIINNVNATGNQTEDDRSILFQNQISLTDIEGGAILSYDERNSANDTEEEEEIRLLYRNKKTYGVGHGCSIQWDEPDNLVQTLSTTVIPVYELPQVTATELVTLSMFQLSDLGDWELGKDSLQQLIVNYRNWIYDLNESIKTLDSVFFPAAHRNIHKCKTNLARIEEGVNILLENDIDSDVVKCFRWMNRAMIWQQQRAKTPRREWNKKGNKNNTSYSLESLASGSQIHSSLKEFHEDKYSGKWRPFQIAFVLMNIKSIWSQESEERNIVDLIWFPTGGGKTEAYLGLAGFSIFSRRIKGKELMDFDLYGGTSILMRYTLRLLTTQQYERASSLICACELIRKESQNELELGPDPISIGLWVGGASTPNKRSEANKLFKQLNGENFKFAEYNFIVMKCPCCGAAIGKLKEPSQNKKITGVHQTEGNENTARVYFSCENTNCEFYEKELPLFVVDDDIFEFCPTLVLGTVDKFAMIPWKSESGKLFGFRRNGIQERITPPELVIQDELHLISGPLGTIVGLYESLVLTLCNNYGRTSPPFFSDKFIKPKIIASSATISRAGEQVKALYASEKLNIFPPQGVNFGDTWFSKEEPPEVKPGRKYIGILAPGYRSGQTSVVRLYSSILQSVLSSDFSPEVKNYYWTLLGFFNSIRELGMAASLVYADIKEYLSTLQNRKLIPYSERRKINLLKELTSRISSSEIPDSLKELEKNFDGKPFSALDICIATNMIATGVDVSRLGLMIIHGQPKTTAEYIQASSRVGRDSKGPGLVVMLYSPSKPRDKSQYEHFQSFHNKIYSYVEPTSVTPFSINSRERALHSVIIGLVRHFSDDHFINSPDISNNEEEFENLITWIKKLVGERCMLIDPSEYKNTMDLFDRRVGFWKFGFQNYGDAMNKGILSQGWIPLMYSRNSEVTEEIREGILSLPSLTSMRGVDEEGKMDILNEN